MAADATTLPLGSSGYSLSPITASVVLMALGLFGWRMLASGLDPREPPEAVSKIPFVGHLIGMFNYQIGYLEILSRKFDFPIYTLRIFSSRIYVIVSPELIHNGLRDTKNLSFEPFIIEASKRLFVMTKQTQRIVGAPSKGDGSETYLSLAHDVMAKALSPGPALLLTNARVLASMAQIINKIGAAEQQISLYRWVRDVITLATAEAFYGPNNPFSNDYSLIEDLWTFENDYLKIVMNFLPQITARRAYLSRARVDDAFRKWYASGLNTNCSPLIRGRAEAASKYGITQTAVAHFEIGIVYTAVTNSVPSAFWLLSMILSSSTLVNQIRTEISSIVTTKRIDGLETLEMDITAFQKQTPLLVSTWEETLRTINAASSVRTVVQDTMLSDKYLLKKGGIVQMPSGVSHKSPQIWGTDANSFNPQRFLKPSSDIKLDSAAKEKRRAQTQGFLPFGGGKHLCPGRHFAFTEIISFVATVVYGYDVKMPDCKDGSSGSQEIKVVEATPQPFGTATKKPKNDIQVLIQRRREFDGIRWTYAVGGEVDFVTLSRGEHGLEK